MEIDQVGPLFNSPRVCLILSITTQNSFVEREESPVSSSLGVLFAKRLQEENINVSAGKLFFSVSREVLSTNLSVNVGNHLHIHAISPTTVPEKASMIEHYEITSEVISLAEQHIIPCIGRLFISLAEILILVQTVS